MLYHASRLTISSAPFLSVLQLAAGRAWARTATGGCAMHTTSLIVNPGNGGATSEDSSSIKDSYVYSAEEDVGSSSHVVADIQRKTTLCRTSTQGANSLISTRASAIQYKGDDGLHPHLARVDRSPRTKLSKTSSIVTTSSVVPLQVDPQTVESLWWIDPARVYLPRYQDVPLWEEINEELPYVGRFRMTPGYSLPIPRTPKNLYQNLHLLLALSPPVSLSGLVRYHAYFDKLHSTKTFNYLIEMSIRNASFGTTRYLFRMMDAQRIPGNLETRKLRVRMLVRTGDWVAAWKQETHEDPQAQFMPVAIWLEFLQIPRRMEELKVAKSKRGGGHGLDPAKTTEIREHSNSLSREEKLLLALKHPPNPTPKEYAEVQPRVICEVVRALLIIDREKAFDLTRKYFNSLPPHITPRCRRQCMDIIHAHLTARTKAGVSEFARIRIQLSKLLKMHADFVPNSTTLFLLLAPLKRTNQCGTIAEATVKKFRMRWGEKIVDLRVKRRVASLAIKEGRRDILVRLLEEGRLHESIRRTWQTEIDARKESRVPPYKMLMRRRYGLIYPRKGREGWKWRLLRRRAFRRLWRDVSRLTSAVH